MSAPSKASSAVAVTRIRARATAASCCANASLGSPTTRPFPCEAKASPTAATTSALDKLTAAMSGPDRNRKHNAPATRSGRCFPPDDDVTAAVRSALTCAPSSTTLTRLINRNIERRWEPARPGRCWPRPARSGKLARPASPPHHATGGIYERQGTAADRGPADAGAADRRGGAGEEHRRDVRRAARAAASPARQGAQVHELGQAAGGCRARAIHLRDHPRMRGYGGPPPPPGAASGQ